MAALAILAAVGPAACAPTNPDGQASGQAEAEDATVEPTATATATTANTAYHRHDSSDRAWNILAPLLPGGPGKVRQPAQDNRRFSSAMLRVLRTGTPPKRPAAGLQTLERYWYPLPSLARQGDLGPIAGSLY